MSITTVRRGVCTSTASSLVGAPAVRDTSPGWWALYHRQAMAQLFSFPNPVNEKAARVVAGGVFVLSIVTLATGAYWLAVVLACGFVARVLSGPTLSPLGQAATRLLGPRPGGRKRGRGGAPQKGG